MLSFWERDTWARSDVLVIGGGLIGTQTALCIKQQAPKRRVTLLERGVLPYGASTRNAGFACFGSLTEILADIAVLGQDTALATLEQRWRGLNRLRQRVGDARMGYEALGGYELLRAAELPALERLDEVNALLHPLFGGPVFTPAPDTLRRAGFGPAARALLENPFEGQVHSGRLIDSLWRMAREAGIDILGGAEVVALDSRPGGGTAYVRQDGDPLAFEASEIVLCTSACSADLVPGYPIVPGRGQVLVTAPIPDLAWRGTYHLDEGFFYFRNVGQRVLLGGGRNLDFVGETTTQMGLSGVVQDSLEALLHELILPGLRCTIEQRWSGLMGFTPDRQPRVERLQPWLSLAFGCNGMGVALSAEIAERAATLLAA